MKRIGSFLLLVTLSLPVFSDGIVDLAINSEHVFVPHGFDANDTTEIVLSGWLPSPCYKRPSGTASVVDDQVYIDLKATKFQVGNSFCLMMAVPYTVSVPVGRLNAGAYKVHVNQATMAPKIAEVLVDEPGSDSIDNFIYADVKHVDAFEDSREVVLTGYNPSDCLELEDVKFVSNKKDVYAVLPIMKQVKEECEKVRVPFNYTKKIPSDLNAEKVLLHVRSMNGHSVNEVFDNYN